MADSRPAFRNRSARWGSTSISNEGSQFIAQISISISRMVDNLERNRLGLRKPASDIKFEMATWVMLEVVQRAARDIGNAFCRTLA